MPPVWWTNCPALSWRFEKASRDANYVNMTDVNSPTSHGRSAAVADSAAEPGAVSVPGARHVAMVELLFFAYRDFTGEADAVLQEFGFGRAHHRVLHFVNRRPGLRVADLLDILRITKQSLARVLKQLVDRGFIAQAAGANDRRERRLYLTQQGADLAAKLVALQVAQIGAALEAAGADGENVVRKFLLAMIEPGQRGSLSEMTDVSLRPRSGCEGRAEPGGAAKESPQARAPRVR